MDGTGWEVEAQPPRLEVLPPSEDLASGSGRISSCSGMPAENMLGARERAALFCLSKL